MLIRSLENQTKCHSSGKLQRLVSDGKYDLYSAATSQMLCLAFPVALSPITCLFSGLYLCSQLLPVGEILSDLSACSDDNTGT